MNIHRLHILTSSGIIPLNFGMDYEGCLNFYDHYVARMPHFCPSDPRSWSQETVDKVNKEAQEQIQLVQRLMMLSDEEFYVEVNRLLEKQ